MHRFQQFKSFEDASLDLKDPVWGSASFTLFIGKNGSGKTNAIEGVELLGELAAGRPLHEIADIGRSASGFEVRGGLQGCPRGGATEFTLGATTAAIFDSERREVEYEITIATRPEPHVLAERLSTGGRTLFAAEPAADLPGKLNVRCDGRSPGGTAAAVQALASRSVLSQVEQLAFPWQRPEDGFVLWLAPKLRWHLRASVFDPKPELMRGYERPGSTDLLRTGSNLASVLHSYRVAGTDAVARISEIVRQLPDQPLGKLDLVPTPLGDVILGFGEVGRQFQDARMLSDGTLRCLAVLTAVETAFARSKVIIEDFDHGIHPSRVGLLVNAIADSSRRRQLNVLCTTQNPATLNALSPELLRGVVLCYWDRAQNASRLVPLLDLPRADVLLEQGRLGDLVTKGILEEHLSPGYEEGQKAKAAAWLDSLT